ncbi:MAG TPA: site-2 protease family protein [Candidatus Absconditabacterales bacterium]|nr:site-2 protease family protein [Candidatus Absconditabacterales bacterium]
MIRAIIIGVLMFMILVILHELGHFITARKSGVKVLEFGIGIPPKICKLGTDKYGTEYTLNAIPLGGFCRMKGEDPSDKKDFHAKDSFIKARFRNKILILAGGVLANLIVAWIIFSTVFAIGTKPLSVLPENAIKGESHSLLMPTYSFLESNGLISGIKIDTPLIVDAVLPDSLAYSLGIQTGDIITNINENSVNVRNVGSVLKENIGENIDIHYTRANTKNIISSKCGEEDCILGLAFVTSGNLEIKEIKYKIPQAMFVGIKEIGAQFDLTFAALGRLGSSLISFNGSKIKKSLGSLTGPVGVVKFGEMLLSSGLRVLYLAFAGMISLALAIFNILPIPALDGGRIIGVLIQKIGGFKVEKYFVIEGYFNTVFFILLMLLGLYIILKDLVVFRGINIPFLG